MGIFSHKECVDASQFTSNVDNVVKQFLINPSTASFVDFEQTLHKQLLDFGDEMTQQALLSALGDADFVDKAIDVHRAKGYHVHGRDRSTAVQLYGGRTICVQTVYMYPGRKKKRGRKRKIGHRGKGGKGVYPVLEMLGIMSGTSPALASEVTLSALNNPFSEAAENLERHGIDVSEKRVRTISEKVGSAALKNREAELEIFENGTLAQGDSFAGKHVVVSIDGGRTRIRQKKKGPKKSGRKQHGFHTDWREPKLFTLYAVDENGKKTNGHTLTFYDGTFDGRDKLKQLLKMNLHKTGALLAESMTFVGDGAHWIWNIIDEIIDELDIDQSKVNKVLDFYHAAEHLWTVIDLLPKLNAQQKERLFKASRRQLKKGTIDDLIEKLGQKAKRKHEACKALRYFHDYEDKCSYDIFIAKNIPISSGAIESAIRRIVNLRLKGAGMFWLKENAEAFLHLRCQFKAGQWKAFFLKLRSSS